MTFVKPTKAFPILKHFTLKELKRFPSDIGTMLQAGRSRFSIPDEIIGFFN
jgi:hypothetical protein